MSGYPISAGRALRVNNLANYAEQLGAKDREIEETKETLRATLGENADLSRRLVESQQLLESYKAREAANRPLLDVAIQSLQQLKG
jgi:septal ring factor EnvC (AmiA/AmiB activator)